MPGGVTLELRDGFNADEVLVRAAGVADLQLAEVSTRLQIGLARSLPLPEAARALNIELPQRGVETHIELRPERPLWVGVSLSRDGKQLQVHQQVEPFGYA